VTRTPEQRAADDELDAALSACSQAYDLLGGGMLLDYVVIVEGAHLDAAGELVEEHFGLCYRNGNGRTTVALGLLAKGVEMLQGGERVVGE
jgi:hypothetical protein